ncbi:MAG: hypothetical protein ABR605_11170, partial [Desulfurivibrionaceae bacterium]
DDKGEIRDLPDLAMAGRSGRDFITPRLTELIPLPEGSELFVLDDRQPVGTDPVTGEFLKLDDDPLQPGRPVRAVAAFMAPAHTSGSALFAVIPIRVRSRAASSRQKSARPPTSAFGKIPTTA